MSIVYIVNPVPFHYEIIESVIRGYPSILGAIQNPVKIYLNVFHDISFQEYIEEKFPDIVFGVPENYDFMINCTIYSNTRMKRRSNDPHDFNPTVPNHFYICHETCRRFKMFPNILFVAPSSYKKRFLLSHLPFSESAPRKTPYPIFAVQGNIHGYRRDFQSLAKILKHVPSHYIFYVKLLGRGKLPQCLLPFRSKIIFKNNLNFIDYHREFLDVYCLLPLLSPSKTPQYFKNKLSSSISYIESYKLRSLMHEALHDRYPELENVHTYSSPPEMLQQFVMLLDQFYLSKPQSN